MEARKKRKIIIIASVSILFLLILNYAALIYVRNEIPKILTNNKEIPYNITYKTLDFSIWNGFIAVDSLVISEKNKNKLDSVSLGVFTKIKKVEINGLSVWQTLFSDKIIADELNIISSKTILYKNENQAIKDYKKSNSAVFGSLGKIFKCDGIRFSDATISIINFKSKKLLLHVANLNLAILGVRLSDKTINKDIPFNFRDYAVSYDSLIYIPYENYQIKTKKLAIENNVFFVSDFKMTPQISKIEFTAKVPQEIDLFNLDIKSIEMNDFNWSIVEKRFSSEIEEIAIVGLNAEIYRNKLPKDDLSKKKLYSQLLRELPIDLNVKTLNISKSLLIYEEEINFEKGPAKLIFNDFNLNAKNIESGFGKSKIPNTTIAISCNFMNTSPLKINWSWNSLNKKETFKINGSVKNFENEAISPFTKPYLNAKVSGKINALYFNFSGNDLVNKGDFKMDYDNLKVEIYQQKNRSKVNKVLTAVGNLFVKNDSKDKPKKVVVEVERNQSKSFYNFLWISIADGLKQVLF